MTGHKAKLYWRIKKEGKWSWVAAVERTYRNPGGNSKYGYGTITTYVGDQPLPAHYPKGEEE
jgi:hypothetical protein